MPPFTFKLRRDTSSRWISVNPILSDGEPGFETDTGLMKIGNGSKTCEEWGYCVPFDPGDEITTLPAHVNAELPHPVYDDGPSLSILYENAKV